MGETCFILGHQIDVTVFAFIPLSLAETYYLFHDRGAGFYIIGTSVVKEFRPYQTSTMALCCGNYYRLYTATTAISHIMAILLGY